MSSRYFLTVDWCKKGPRGVFCNKDGVAYPKDGEPHTKEEMHEILGVFWLVLDPEPLLLTEAELSEYCYWKPLAEYSNQFGVATKREDVPIRVLEMEELK